MADLESALNAVRRSMFVERHTTNGFGTPAGVPSRSDANGNVKLNKVSKLLLTK
jgi:hypothetical protein